MPDTENDNFFIAAFVSSWRIMQNKANLLLWDEAVLI